MTNHDVKTKFAGLLAFGLVLAAFCTGCGEKQDYSGTGELSKLPTNPAATPNPSAGAPTSVPALSVPKQERPPSGK